MNRKPWNRPELQVLDTVVELTAGGLDKVGSSVDYLTKAHGLDGDIFEDPA